MGGAAQGVKSGGTRAMTLVGVADDGAIYLANLTANAATTLCLLLLTTAHCWPLAVAWSISSSTPGVIVAESTA